MRYLYAVAFVAVALAVSVLTVPAAFAQGNGGKNTASNPIPYYSATDSGTFTSADGTAAFVDEVPAGKRLVVEHVSVWFRISSTTGVTYARCQIQGNTPGSIYTQGFHWIPLQNDLDAFGTTFTAGSPLKIYFESGQVKVTCSAGGNFDKHFYANVSGQLVDAL